MTQRSPWGPPAGPPPGWPAPPTGPAPRSAALTVLFLVLAVVSAGMALMLMMLGSCHDTGGFCTSDFNGQNLFAYVAGAAAAATSGTFAFAAVLPRLRPALLGAGVGLVIGVLAIGRLEG